jgi:exodeoxyribonuclease-5
MLWLNAIDTEGPSMSAADQNTLYAGVLESYADLKTKEERRKALRSDPFYNALQIKFAYAVTCHKAQGGQWPIVFVDQGYMTDEMLDIEYLRWLYTAITRAREKLFLLNFSDAVFEQE